MGCPRSRIGERAPPQVAGSQTQHNMSADPHRGLDGGTGLLLWDVVGEGSTKERCLRRWELQRHGGEKRQDLSHCHEKSGEKKQQEEMRPKRSGRASFGKGKSLVF